MDREKKALCYGLSAVLLWSTVATAFKLSLRHLAPHELLLWAALTTVVLLGAVLGARGKLGEALTCGGRDLGRSALLGLLNPCLYYLVLFRAYDLLQAQEAQVLNYTWAITLSLLAVPLLKQKLGFRDGCAIAVCYLGVVVIATRGDWAGFHFSNPAGVGLALLSTLFWALYWIFNTRDSREPLQALFLNFLFGAFFVLLYSLFFAGLRVPSWQGLAGALYVGIFEMGLTFVLWLQALKLTSSAARISNLIFISPILSLILIHFLVGEEIYSSTLASLGLIITGLVVQQLGKRPA